MLKKLLKYDFKSMSKMMWSINLGILVLSVLASVMFSVNMRVSGHRVAQSSVFSQILNIVTILFTVFAVHWPQSYFHRNFISSGRQKRFLI